MFIEPGYKGEQPNKPGAEHRARDVCTTLVTGGESQKIKRGDQEDHER